MTGQFTDNLRAAERALAKALDAAGLPNAMEDDWTAEAMAVLRAFAAAVGHRDEAGVAAAVWQLEPQETSE